jgi:GNAT superfamily N-acetyltransferase
MLVVDLDISDPAVAAELLALQRSSYAVEAALIGSDEIPPLHESLEELRDAPLQWRGIRMDGCIVAAIAFTGDGTIIDIDRLVVAPRWFRRGLASGLLGTFDGHEAITVATGTDNTPAHFLYARHGFVAAGTSTPVPGLSVTHFVRNRRE